MVYNEILNTDNKDSNKAFVKEEFNIYYNYENGVILLFDTYNSIDKITINSANMFYCHKSTNKNGSWPSYGSGGIMKSSITNDTLYFDENNHEHIGCHKIDYDDFDELNDGFDKYDAAIKEYCDLHKIVFVLD